MLDNADDYLLEFGCHQDWESRVSALKAEKLRPGELEAEALCRIYDVSLVLYSNLSADPKIYHPQVMKSVAALHRFEEFLFILLLKNR